MRDDHKWYHRGGIKQVCGPRERAELRLPTPPGAAASHILPDREVECRLGSEELNAHEHRRGRCEALALPACKEVVLVRFDDFDAPD